MTAGFAATTLLGNMISLIVLFALQFYLCSKQNRWLGLILPGGFFIYSVYLLMRTFMLQLLPECSIMMRILVAFISPNINTALLLLIYRFARRKA